MSIFDEVVDRRNTGSVKWDHALNEETICMDWADMDFKAPEKVIGAMKAAADFGVYGYVQPDDHWYQTITSFCSRRYGWSCQPEWLSYAPGVISALAAAVEAFTEPGDKVIIQSPVFVRFRDVVESNRRIVSDSCLKFDGTRYTMDFEDLEQRAADPDTKLFLLCSPHNPVCRVWTQEELKRAGDICLKHQVIMVVDEIHCDMIFQPYRHHTFASLGEEYAMNSVICLSTSKTFNLAGLQTAVAAIPNLSLKQKFDQVLHSRDISRPTLFGQEAMRAAYQYGDTWLDELIQYIQGNFEYTYHKINGATDQMRVIDSEGTYLAWIDCSGLGLNSNEIQPFFLNQANVSLTSGAACGPGGEQFIRMNLAYPRSVVTEAVTRLLKAIHK